MALWEHSPHRRRWLPRCPDAGALRRPHRAAAPRGAPVRGAGAAAWAGQASARGALVPCRARLRAAGRGAQRHRASGSPSRPAPKAGATRPPADSGEGRATAPPLTRPAGWLRGRSRCSQHPRHQGRRRLRRRGPVRLGRWCCRTSAGHGEAGGDPAVRCALSRRSRLDPHRHGAAGAKLRQHDLRTRQFRLLRVPRPQPCRRCPAFRARPRQRARCPRLQACQWPLDLFDRPHCAAGAARECPAFGLRAVCNGAGAGLGLVP